MNKQKCNKELYCQLLVASQNNYTATGMAEHLNNISHDSINRWLTDTKLTPSILWEQAKEFINPSKKGFLVCDDSVLEKPRSEQLPLVKWQYSGTKHRVVKGVGLVTLFWSDGSDHIPTDFRLYAKHCDGYTKNQHFQQMLRLSYERGTKPEAVIFDTWYASQANLNLINSLSWKWITQLRKNRVVNFRYHLEGIDVPPQGTLVDLKLVGQVRVFKFIAKDGNIEYWATNDFNLTADDIRRAAATRWKIEEYHRGLKQLTGIERCQSRNQRSQRNHIFCSIMSFLSLEQYRLKTDVTWYKAKRQIVEEAITNYMNSPTIPLAFALTA